MSEPTILKLIDKPTTYPEIFIENVKCNNTHSFI